MLDFIQLKHEKAISDVYSPLIASLVVAEHQDRLLLVFDRYKQSWELPGGAIEVGESPRACAIRELMEETGQSTNDLDFVGVGKFHMKDGNVTFAAVYSCRLITVYPFQANDEIEMTNYWDFKSNIGYVDEIDQYIATVVINH